VSDITTQFRAIVGADAVETGSGVRAFRADNIAPQWVLFPTTVDELSRCAAAATEAGLSTIPVGNGTQLGIGRVPYRYDVALSTRRLRRIVAHEAADLTVTVEAGLPLADLNAALAESHQWLPLDPPHPEWTTIGALIASDASGPSRLSQGTVRDLLIGITTVLADGTVVHGGGRVVKNVAGYDLMKLFTGSFGTLGVVVEATFKIRPRPERFAMWTIAAADHASAIACAREVLDAPMAPLYVEVLNALAASAVGIDLPAAIVVGCGGSDEEIELHAQRLAAVAGERPLRRLDDGGSLYAALRDFPVLAPHPAEGTAVYGSRLSVLPTRLRTLLPRIEMEAQQYGLALAALSHVGSGVALLRFQARPPDDEGFARFADWLREEVSQDSGWVLFDVLPAALKERVDPWGPAIPGLDLMRGIKDTLDPQRRLSPGRFVGGI